MSQIRRDRVAFFPPLGVAALVDGPVQFVSQRLRPLARLARGGDRTPLRNSAEALRAVTGKIIRVATIDIDRDPWWVHLRRRR
ncbi:MAG: hypothetical protein K2Y21_14965 [Phycisphaerales bacterium]|nr:hypothetical protein [Phycisphaerales bacterium]